MTPAEAHAEAVRRIQDCQGLTKLNDIVGGYAFAMILSQFVDLGFTVS